MRLHVTLLLSLSCLLASAQPFNWQWSVNDTATLGTPTVEAFATDALGNSYVTGTFYGTATFGSTLPVTSAGQGDVYVTKYDNQGVALWSVRAGGSDFDYPFDLAIDGNGGVFITGAIESATAEFGATTLSLIGQMDVFVAKLDASNGDFLWSQRYGSNDFQADHREWGKAIACDADGNVYVSGCFKYSLAVPGLPQLDGCSQYYNSFLMKLNTDGNGVWSRRPDCGQQWALSASEGQVLTVGADAMLYAGWRARGDTIFYETDTLLNDQTSGQTHEGVVAKYDLDGNYEWSRVIGGYGYDDVQALQADAEGHVYIAMHREGSYGHLGVLNIEVAGSLGIYRNVILKTNADGAFLWGTRLGNSTYDHDIEAMALEGAETLLVAGWHQGNFEIGGVTPNPGVTGTYGLYLARFDSSSALLDLHASRYQYTRRILGLGLDEGGNIYIAGGFQDSLSFPGLPAMDIAAADYGSIFVARSGDFNTDIPSVGASSGASTFPMPCDGRFTIQSARPFSELRIMNALGEVVLRETFPSTAQHHVQLEKSGAYFYSLWTSEERVASGRAVVRP